MKKDFITITDWSEKDLSSMIDLAVKLKKQYVSKGNSYVLKDKVLAMIFTKPSLRTRVSFDMAMRQLGGDALYLSPDEIGLGKRESIGDVARVLSGYVDAIMARVFAYEDILELAKWSAIPVINGLSDYNHPCQALADFLTIYEHYKKKSGLKISFVGDSNNVATSLMYISLKLGNHFTIASPRGFKFSKHVVETAKSLLIKNRNKFDFYTSPEEAVKDADVVYTDTWTSMGQENQIKLRESKFFSYQVNKKLMNNAKKTAIFMHCLPAHRGKEVTDEVADSEQSVIFKQAQNRLHAQKAILVKLLSKY